MAAGIVYCLWVQYGVSSERWVLMAAVAFGGLAVGGLVHALSWTGAVEGIRGLGLRYHSASRIAAACLLVCAAYSAGSYSLSDRRRKGRRAFACAGAVSLCLAAAVLILNRSWVRLSASTDTATVLARIGRYACSPHLMEVLSLAGLVTACVVFARQHVRQWDEFSDGAARFLLLIVSAQAASLVSACAYGPAWWVSHVFAFLGLAVLLVQLGKEFGGSHADAHARIEHLEAVHRMSSHLSTTLDLDVVLHALVSDIADMLSARFASVMLADEAGGSLTTVATHGLPEDVLRPSGPQGVEESARLGFQTGHIVRAFREKRVCVVDDVFTDVGFIPWWLLATCDGYTVSVPLVCRGVALGVVNLFFDRCVPLTDERIRLFQTLASAGAAAVGNAQLHRRTLQDESDDASGESSTRFRLAS